MITCARLGCDRRFKPRATGGSPQEYCSRKCLLAARRNQYHRRHTMKHKYGLSSEDYKKLVSSQGGKCAICLQPETAIIQGRLCELSVDHCHITQKIRGLLCSSCNRALGIFEDDPMRLQRAIAYLEAARGLTI